MAGVAGFERAGKVRRLAAPRSAQRPPQKKPTRSCAPGRSAADPAASPHPSAAAAAAAAAGRGQPGPAERDGEGAAGADGDSDSRGAVVLEACKFVSKRSKEACPALPSVVCHKRGHLAVCCSAGHQWVWCRTCCSCERGGGPGCADASHWFERDAFDTGRRNHMNRHRKGAD